MTKDGAIEIGVVAGPIRGHGNRGQGGSGCRPLQAREIEGADPLTGALQGRAGDDGLELADVAWPAIGGEAGEGTGGKTTEEPGILPIPLAEEEAGENGDVFAALAQRGEGEANGGEMAGQVGAERATGGELAKGPGGTEDQLAGRGNGETAEAEVGGALQKIAQQALLVRGYLIDAGEIDQTAAGFGPEILGGAEEISSQGGKERTGGGGADAVEGLRRQQLPGAGFSFEGDEAKMGRGAAHAGEELLHDEAAADHGAQHPFFGLKGLRFQSFEGKRVGERQ